MAMFAEQPSRGAAARKMRLAIGALISVLIHILMYWLVGLLGPRASASLQLEIPAEIEFAVHGEGGGGGKEGTGEQQSEPGETGKNEAPEPTIPEKPKTRPRRARRSEPAPALVETAVETPSDDEPENDEPVDAGPSRSAQRIDDSVDASLAASGIEADGGTATAATMPGAGSGTGGGMGSGIGTGIGDGWGIGQSDGGFLAVRFDTKRLRDSVLILEMDALLRVVPGWRGLFRGTGIEPLDDLKRVFVASSILDPARLVVLGRHRGGVAGVKRIASRIARKVGRPATRSALDGVTTVAWRTSAGLEREMSVFPDGTFAIHRARDRASVLAVVRGYPSIWENTGAAPSSAPILALERNETVVFMVEGVRHYLRGFGAAAPERLRMAISEKDQYTVDGTITAQYPSPSVAERGKAVISARFKALSEHELALYHGLSSALQEVSVARNERDIEIGLRLTLHQLRRLFEIFREAIKSAAPSRGS